MRADIKAAARPLVELLCRFQKSGPRDHEKKAANRQRVKDIYGKNIKSLFLYEVTTYSNSGSVLIDQIIDIPALSSDRMRLKESLTPRDAGAYSRMKSSCMFSSTHFTRRNLIHSGSRTPNISMKTMAFLQPLLPSLLQFAWAILQYGLWNPAIMLILNMRALDLASATDASALQLAYVSLCDTSLSWAIKSSYSFINVLWGHHHKFRLIWYKCEEFGCMIQEVG